MAGRELQACAVNVLSAFVSRNNDVDGYWGIGKLCRAALDRSIDGFVLDLLTIRSDPSEPLVDRVASHFHEVLRRQPEFESLAHAELKVQFTERTGDRTSPTYHCQCTLRLATRTGRSATASDEAWCWPHDPERELGRSD